MSAPLGDARHVCFICLQTDTDEPNGPWVNPCPCSLEAHQNCMLQWIAESEYEASRSVGSRRSPLKCPACKGRIRLEEPHDPVVALYNKFLRGYSRVSPMFLLSLVSGGTVIGSAWYGMTAFSIFAGPKTALRWLAVRPLLNGRRDVSAWHAALSTMVKLTQLSLIGPTLISLWAVPASVVLSMPASLMFAATLITQDHAPSWPPSPHWAMVGIPYVHMVYEFVYNKTFASFERRLDRALRGRPPVDTPEELAAQQAAPAANRPAADEDRRNNNAGAWAIITALGGLVNALFQDPRQPNADGDDVDLEVPDVGGHIQIEVDIGGPAVVEEDANEDAEEDAEPAVEEEDDAEPAAEEEDEALALADDAGADANDELFQIINEAPAADEPAPADERIPDEDILARAEEAAEQQPPRRPIRMPRAGAPRDRPHRPRRRNRQNAAPGANEENFDAEPRLSVFSVISNGIATTLLLPVISFAAGELIRALVPASWTNRQVAYGTFRRPKMLPATGILQKRWGRSLVGACLYYVLRDAFSLFYKYRKVQVKTKRRVRNVQRKAGEEHTAAPGTVV